MNTQELIFKGQYDHKKEKKIFSQLDTESITVHGTQRNQTPAWEIRNPEKLGTQRNNNHSEYLHMSLELDRI